MAALLAGLRKGQKMHRLQKGKAKAEGFKAAYKAGKGN